MPDAPDYTLLSDVNVVGSVTLDVNVVGSVTINTNITGVESGVTFDVNITHSDITLDVVITNATVTLNVNITNEVLQSKLAKPVLAFNGENAYVRVADSPSLDITNEITLSVWFKTNVTHDGALIWKALSTYSPTYGFAYFGEVYGRIVGRIVDSGGTTHEVNFAWTPDGGWHNLVMTYDGSVQKIYLDGELKNSLEWSDTIATSDYDVIIGDRETAHIYFDGLVSVACIWNRALTAEEVKYIYNNPQSLPTKGLVLWLNLDEGSGTTAYDKSGYGNHGTIYNALWVSEHGRVVPLLNVNLTASQITLNVNVTNSVLTIQGNVEITNAELNIRITAQDVNVKIITPSGIPAYIGTSFVNKTETGITVINAGSESDALLSLTGRGRLISIAFWLRTGDPDSDASRSGLMDNEIRIYIDGSSTPQVTITMEELDRLNGHQIWGQAINAGAGTVGNYTAPLGPRGGIGFAQRASYVTVDGFEATRVCGLYKCDVEFTTGLVVKWYNPDSVNLSVNLIFEYGHYPGGE